MTHWTEDKIYVTSWREKSSSKVNMSSVICCSYLGMFFWRRFAWCSLKLTNKTQSESYVWEILHTVSSRNKWLWSHSGLSSFGVSPFFENKMIWSFFFFFCPCCYGLDMICPLKGSCARNSIPSIEAFGDGGSNRGEWKIARDASPWKIKVETLVDSHKEQGSPFSFLGLLLWTCDLPPHRNYATTIR